MSDAGECVLWGGNVNKNGYGRVRVDGKLKYAHRHAWEQAVGPIPEGLTIDHLCRVKLCVNVRHMEVVTRGENARRRNAAVTHCPGGHEYTAENTVLTEHRDGYMCRACRECHRTRNRRAA